MLYLKYGADEYLKYFGASDSADDSYLNSGTCTYAIYENSNGSLGTAVSGGTGTLSYIASSNGNYRGIIDAAVTGAMTVGAYYWIVITFVQGNYNDQRTLAAQCVRRGAT